jgi:hypothetical protein
MAGEDRRGGWESQRESWVDRLQHRDTEIRRKRRRVVE